jgi:hypothetical protein
MACRFLIKYSTEYPGRFGCDALVHAAKRLNPNLPRGWRIGAWWLDEISYEDIPF